MHLNLHNARNTIFAHTHLFFIDEKIVLLDRSKHLRLQAFPFFSRTYLLPVLGKFFVQFELIGNSKLPISSWPLHSGNILKSGKTDDGCLCNN